MALDLGYRRVAHLLGIMYHRSKCKDLLDNRAINTRQFDKVKFKVLNPVVKKTFKSPNYLGAQLWDKLPKDVRYLVVSLNLKGESKNLLLKDCSMGCDVPTNIETVLPHADFVTYHFSYFYCFQLIYLYVQ